MRINNASNLTFESVSKTGRISEKARVDADRLLKMMDDSAKYSINPDKTSYTMEMYTSLNLGKKIKFINNRYFYPAGCKERMKENFPDFTIEIGNNRLDVNRETGNVIKYRTGIFTGLKRLISKAENAILDMACNFNNPDVVKKNTLGIRNYLRNKKV